MSRRDDTARSPRWRRAEDATAQPPENREAHRARVLTTALISGTTHPRAALKVRQAAIARGGKAWAPIAAAEQPGALSA